MSATASTVRLLAEIVRSVPSPSIFSLSPPNTIPTLLGTCISDVAVRLILAPDVIVKSVLSPSIFSPVPKVIPTSAGTTISATAVRLILLPLIVKSVPSPSIFSPSLPKVKPMLAGILISPPEPTLMLISVPSDSIFSSPEPSRTNPVFAASTTSAVAVRLILLPLIVKSVPSPSIFSPSFPNVNPISAGILMSPPEPTVIVKSVPSDSIFSAVAKVSPTPDGILTSATAVRLMLLPDIVRSVPSPSIFSPSSPNVKPMFAGMFISALATRFKSVPSP